ncbi:HET-domain-containing protein [Hypoxylon sp. FL0890]|nr:HET-domain-containing protein [Hypoxylon sp. FL0890]
MRLLNSKTLELVDFPGDVSVKYAILSHTWGKEEVLFQDIQKLGSNHKENDSFRIQSTAGYAKIRHCAQQAQMDGLEYIWVDTCCIDKSSNAELQEAINSMYRWYNKSEICYAYLSDVNPGDNPHREESAFRRCRWFTRGWTLQELLAPNNVLFFDREWNMLGSKRELAPLIQEITGIRTLYLLGISPNKASIAERMSWASHRSTTRVEDIAYCLLGIFDLSMPMLYGEGEKAFEHLQEKIMKEADDASILAWGYPGPSQFGLPGYSSNEGLLARNPNSFGRCGNVKPLMFIPISNSFAMTQRGMVMTLPIRTDPNHENLIYGILNCGFRKRHRTNSHRTTINISAPKLRIPI